MVAEGGSVGRSCERAQGEGDANTGCGNEQAAALGDWGPALLGTSGRPFGTPLQIAAATTTWREEAGTLSPRLSYIPAGLPCLRPGDLSQLLGPEGARGEHGRHLQ